MIIKHIGIARLLLAVVAACILLLLAIAGSVWLSTASIAASADDIVSNALAKTGDALILNNRIVGIQLRTRGVIFATDQETRQKRAEAYRQTREQATSALKSLLARQDGTQVSAEEKEVLINLRSSLERVLGDEDQVIALALDGKTDEATKLETTQARTMMMNVQKAAGTYITMAQQDAQDSAERIQQETSRSRRNLLIVVLVAALVALVGGLWLAQSIRRPLEAAVVILESLAQGDLTAGAEADPTDHSEVGRLRMAAQRTGESLALMITDIKAKADRVSEAALSLLASVEDVRRGSASQSEATTSMAEALDRLSEGGRRTAELSRRAEDESRASGEHAGEGRAAMAAMTEDTRQIDEVIAGASATATELDGKATEISRIIAVIDDVAGQTNLLALNAAIEAARAGEQGRGFAVVADEVRKLAEKSARSAGEITRLVESIVEATRRMGEQMCLSVQRVQRSRSSVEGADGMMVEIGQSAQRGVDAIAAASASIREQSEASAEIARRVDRVLEIVASNGTAVDSVSHTADELNSLAGALRNEVARFRL